MGFGSFLGVRLKRGDAGRNFKENCGRNECEIKVGEYLGENVHCYEDLP